MLRDLARLMAMLAVAFTAIAVPTQSRASTETNQEYVFKAIVEARLEERLKSALSEIAGTEKLIVLVNADVEADVKQLDAMRKASESAKRQSRGLVLPGVPVKKEIGRESELPEAVDFPPSVVKSIRVIVLVGENLADELIDVMRDVTINAIGYNPDRGDVIDIRQLEFTKKNFPWATLFRPPHLYYVVLIALGAALTFALATFFLNPYRQLANVFRSVNWGALRGQPEGPEREGGEAASAAAAAGMVDEGEDGTRPFSFVRDKLIRELAFILDKGPTADAAIVVNYMQPEMAAKLIEMFPPGKQAEILVQLGTGREIDPRRVRELDESLRARLEYVVGGDTKLATILNLTVDEVRARVIDSIEETDAETAARLRRRVKGFEETMRDLPSTAIQHLYRQSEPTTFALVVMSTPGDIQKKVIDALSEGAAERLQEEMRLSHPLSRARLRRERNNLLALVRRLVQAGVLEDYED